MNENKYLNEEKYQKINSNIKKKGKLITNIMLVIGIAMIVVGVSMIIINKNSSTKNENSINEQIVEKEKALETEEDNLTNKLSQLKTDLETKKQALIDQGVEKSYNYNDGEAYDLYILDSVLDPRHYSCMTSEYQNNELTKDYCAITNLFDRGIHGVCGKSTLVENYCALNTELSDLRQESIFPSQPSLIKSAIYIPLIMFGFFITVASFMVKYWIFMLTHRREITAFTAQQAMPVAKEVMEDMAPTVGKAGKTIAKEMAPVYGDMAKEIAKGIKEGLKDEEEK